MGHRSRALEKKEDNSLGDSGDRELGLESERLQFNQI